MMVDLIGIVYVVLVVVVVVVHHGSSGCRLRYGGVRIVVKGIIIRHRSRIHSKVGSVVVNITTTTTTMTASTCRRISIHPLYIYIYI